MMMFRFFIAGLPSSLLAMERRTPLSLTASRRRWATPSRSASVSAMRSASAANKPSSPSARRRRYSTTFTKSVAARGATLMSSAKKNSAKLAAVAVALGSWLSGYFILVTNAFMQHPVGYSIAPTALSASPA